MDFKKCVLVLCFFNLPLQSLHSPFYMALLEFWFGLILNFFIYFLIGNKSKINHDEKRKKKYMVFMMVNKRKNNIKEKITQGTILRVERSSMIEKQFKEPQKSSLS